MPETSFAAAALGLPNPSLLDPRQRRSLLVLTRLRQEAAAEVERLIAFLDTTEPDADFEPSLGAIEPGGFDPTLWAGGTTDGEQGDDNGVADQDAFDTFEEREAALGWGDDVDQTDLAQGLFETGPLDSGVCDSEALADVEAGRLLALRADACWRERRAAIAAAEAALKSFLAKRRAVR